MIRHPTFFSMAGMHLSPMAVENILHTSKLTFCVTMATMYDFNFSTLPSDFHWFNEPKKFYLDQGLIMITAKETDFWQNTHYGFQRDNGHCLFTKIAGDFTLLTHVEFEPKSQYDQCGLMVRIDQENWIKVSTEFENMSLSRLGSVVTNLGYSDWATQDISSDQREMWYKINRRANDYLIHFSYDGRNWTQLRIAHLHPPHNEVQAGLYACSPTGENFRCRFNSISLEK